MAAKPGKPNDTFADRGSGSPLKIFRGVNINTAGG